MCVVVCSPSGDSEGDSDGWWSETLVIANKVEVNTKAPFEPDSSPQTTVFYPGS